MIEIVVVTIILTVVSMILFLIWWIEIEYMRNRKKIHEFNQRYIWLMNTGLKESAYVIRVRIIQEFGHTWI